MDCLIPRPINTTSYYAAMRAAGWAHVSMVERAVANGIFKAAARAENGKRRIEIDSLLKTGITLEAIQEAEQFCASENRQHYQRRKARAKKTKEISNV